MYGIVVFSIASWFLVDFFETVLRVNVSMCVIGVCLIFVHPHCWFHVDLF